jgi:hypothetical protein
MPKGVGYNDDGTPKSSRFVSRETMGHPGLVAEKKPRETPPYNKPGYKGTPPIIQDDYVNPNDRKAERGQAAAPTQPTRQRRKIRQRRKETVGVLPHRRPSTRLGEIGG